MLVETNFSEDSSDALSEKLRLHRFQTESTNEVLFYGIATTNDKQIPIKYSNFKRRVLFNYWSPCEFTCNNSAGSAFDMNRNFTEIYQICPYTTKWLSNIDKSRKYKYSFFPVDITHIPSSTEKTIDVGYHGGIHGDLHRECVDIIKKFNHNYSSQIPHGNLTTPPMLPYETMLDRLSKVKISINYHLVPLSDRLLNHVKTNYPSCWGDNLAFSDTRYFPQMKVRQHESSLCKCLNLVYRDKWNVVENHYTPDKDFIYFESNRELEELIGKILKSWDKYEHIVNSAYNKCLRYKSENLYNLIKSGEEYVV